MIVRALITTKIMVKVNYIDYKRRANRVQNGRGRPTRLGWMGRVKRALHEIQQDARRRLIIGKPDMLIGGMGDLVTAGAKDDHIAAGEAHQMLGIAAGQIANRAWILIEFLTNAGEKGLGQRG